MKRWKLFNLVLVLSPALWAVPRLGGIGLIYTQSAQTLHQGTLEFMTGTRYFGKIASFGQGRKAYTLWNVQQYASLNYGIGPHIELAVSPILYQDTNRGKGDKKYSKEAINIPDDLFLSVKLGSYGMIESPYRYGVQWAMRIPTADQHNIIYEPYSAGRVAMGLWGLFTYFQNVTFPEEGWSLHANLGYWNHNDVGVDLTDSPTDPSPQSMSSEILFAAGFYYPALAFDFSIEVSASAFLTRPPETAYSREYVSYLTPAVYYRPFPWLTFQTALDIRLFSDRDLTFYAPKTHLPPPPTPDFPNYPGWRGILGAKITILPRSIYGEDKETLRKKTEERRRLLERMLEEDRRTQNAEEELRRIQTERQKVEQELERLRKLLEAEKKKNE